MKRFFVLAALVLGLAACQTEPEGLDVNVGGEVDTTITVSLPDSETRANSALGAFENVDWDQYTIRYILQVYYNNEPSKERLVKYSDDKSVTFGVRLVPGRHYNFVVWADIVEDGTYAENYYNNEDGLHYNTTDLHNITLKQTWVAMDETRDAFTGYFNTQEKDSNKPYNGKMSINIPLTRPFAKLRVVTTDTEQLNNLRIKPTKATVEYTVAHYNAFNAFAGKVIDDSKNRNIKHEKFTIDSYGEDVINGADMTLFTDYFFAKSDAEVINFTMDVFDQNGTSIKLNNFNTPIPARRNYLTTITGDILTDGNNIKVEVENDGKFEGEIEEKIVEVGNATDLQEAINESDEDTTIVLGGDINLNDGIITLAATRAGENAGLIVPAGKSVVLDLNGYTISARDYATAGYALITNKGNLTINGEGTLKITGAENNRGWGAYSSVISNQPGGNLTVNAGVTIEHFGGTAMAYGIDNLTNGKGTSAIVTINGATVKSTYRAVRQFLNGVEATNEFYVNKDSRVESTGGNKAIWMQDPSKNANTGKLVVAEGAFVYSVYLDVTPGSTEWPVEVSVAASSLTDTSENKGIYTDGIPAGYEVVLENGVYTVLYTCAAKIGDVEYHSLQAAVDAVEDGETIVLQRDVNIATPAYGQNALNHARAINFTLDLNGKTITANTGNSVFRFNIADSGATSNVVLTLKNGTVTAGENTWCAVMATGISNNAKAVFNLENMTINSSKANDYAVKAWSNSVINATNVTINATKCAGGFYAVGGEIVLTNCAVNQKGLHTAPYMSMAIGVSSNGKATVNSGNYTTEPTAASEGYNQGTSHGSWCAGVMNSGGELIINGGTFANGNFGDDALATHARGLIFGDTASKIVINDGTFNALKTVIDYQNNLGVQPNPNIVINGGNFSANPAVVTSYGGVVLAEGKVAAQGADGRWTLIDGVMDEAGLKAAFEKGGNIVLGADITVSETVTLAEGKTAVLNLNGKTLAHAEMATKYAINNLGTLTITGNGTVNSRGIYNGYGNDEANVASATLTIENGTFNAKGENGGAAVFNYGTAYINGGSFTSIGGYSLNNQVGSAMTIAEGVTANNGVYTTGATLTINGGEISGNRSGCHVIYGWNANITINGGTFYNNNSGNSTVMAAGTTTITYNGGNYGIKDGRVPGNGNTWTSCLLDSANSATAVINGGTYNGGFRVQAGSSMTINDGSFNDCYGSAYNIIGTTTVKGGTYTDATAIAFAKKYIAEGYEMNANGEVVAK